MACLLYTSLREQTPEKEEMQDTSGHNVQKTEPEIDGDEIIDLGDETEQVLAEMKKTLDVYKRQNQHSLFSVIYRHRKEMVHLMSMRI